MRRRVLVIGSFTRIWHVKWLLCNVWRIDEDEMMIDKKKAKARIIPAPHRLSRVV